jgi:hypothetical protein
VFSSKRARRPKESSLHKITNGTVGRFDSLYAFVAYECESAIRGRKELGGVPGRHFHSAWSIQKVRQLPRATFLVITPELASELRVSSFLYDPGDERVDTALIYEECRSGLKLLPMVGVFWARNSSPCVEPTVGGLFTNPLDEALVYMPLSELIIDGT